MKCPRCGNEMILDSHRKIPLQMCYSCGYIEGRTFSEDDSHINNDPEHVVTNYEHAQTLNFNEEVAFICKAFNLDEKKVEDWLNSPYKP